ncbi:hypothetical protein TEA_019704 [Camellia sinensis var. sinensis]|uniref:DNA (cytosine-5-)-methyltransferase n=1 Tax=Camellia sinensis var. sinensis TaxID=542762 RepID=A0A4S4DGA2_CAMSN|nr:hypothetical protein TEA_019704 [Camellia sinensis var. sinensis]
MCNRYGPGTTMPETNSRVNVPSSNQGVPKTLNKVPDYAINFCDGKSTRPFSRLWWDETVPTLLCRPDLHSQSILHPEQDRVLTIRECARLQGFPDYYEFCGSVKERYCQVGNAVAIPVARALGFALGMAVRKLTGDEPIMTLPPKFSHSTASCCNLHPI